MLNCQSIFKIEGEHCGEDSKAHHNSRSDAIACIRSENGSAGGSPAVDTVGADGRCAKGTEHGSNRSEFYDDGRDDKRGTQG